MARRRYGFKPSLRETMQANARALGFMALAAPIEKAKDAEAFVQTVIAAIPEPRKRRSKPEPEGVDIDRVHRPQPPLESEVVTAISLLLNLHPKILFAVRQNSGAASYEAASGRYAPVQFYRILRSSENMTVVDFWGLLRSGRMFAIEAKRPGWKGPHGDREHKQAAFLAMVRETGGIGIFATSADEVTNALA